MAKREDSELLDAAESELANGLLDEALLALTPQRPMPEGRERLLQAVEKLPLRYAPFFSRLGALWQLEEAQIETVLAESARVRWRRLWPGIRFHSVQAGPELGDARARLLRFEAGVRFPAHSHLGEEQVLVMQGSYTDSLGRTVRAGELQSMAAGSSHSLRVGSEGPCVAAIVQRGLGFTGPLLRRVNRLISF